MIPTRVFERIVNKTYDKEREEYQLKAAKKKGD